MHGRRPCALVAEVDPQMAHMVAFILESEGIDTRVVHDGLAARSEWRSGSMTIAVLNVDLPRIDGLTLCREIRAVCALPIMLLAARPGDLDVIAGLEAGADDYVVTPFMPRILALRAAALVRRATSATAANPVVIRDLQINMATRVVRTARGFAELTDAEWRLLYALIDRCGEVVTWQWLLGAVWQTPDWTGGHGLVKSAICRLRQRLGDDAADPRYIQTIRGVGYRMIDDSGRSTDSAPAMATWRPTSFRMPSTVTRMEPDDTPARYAFAPEVARAN